MKKKIGLLLLICLIMALMPFTVFAAEEPSLEIVAKNITFKDSVFLKFAVSSENADDVKMLVWTSPQSSYEYGTQKVVLSSDGTQTISGKVCKTYTFTGLTASQMTDDVYGRAYTVKNGIAYYSEVVKYSILDYAYSKLGKTGTASTNQKLIKVLNTMLEYGAAAQEYYGGGQGYHLERLANEEYYQVRVIGGLLEIGFDRHLYKQGASVMIKADSVDENGNTFSHWENSAGVSVGTSAEMQIVVGTANEQYTAVYGETVPVSYTVTFADYDGSIISTQSVESGGNAVPPADPTRDGYVFTGWDGNYTNVTEDVTVTATYSQAQGGTNAHTVTFYDYDGTTVLTSKSGIEEGGYAEPPADPVKAGASFLGWEGVYANVTADQSVKAVYDDEKNVLMLPSVSGNVGDTVTMLLSLDGKVKTCGFDISLMYDPALELVSYDADLDLDIVANPDAFENGMKLNFSSASEKTKQRDVIELTFKIGATNKNALPVELKLNSIKELSGSEPVDTDCRLIGGIVKVN